MTEDPEEIRQLLAWQHRLEGRGRKRKKPPAAPRMVPMFDEIGDPAP